MKTIKLLLVIALLAAISVVPQSAASLKQASGRSILAETKPNTANATIPSKTDPQDTPVVTGELTQDRQDPELSKILREYDRVKLDPEAAASQVRRTGKLSIGTSAGKFDLKLAPHDLRSPDYRAQMIDSAGVVHQLPSPPVNTYKGQVSGNPDAQARLTVKGGTLEGSIITRNERYFLQPARDLSRTSKSDEFVFYRGSDVIKDAGECGVTLADEVAAEEERARAAAESGKTSASHLETSEITALSPLKVVRLATDADAEYVAALGGVAQANAQIMSIMNQVDGIYQVEIGVTFQIIGQNTWPDAATDPYTSTAVSGTTTLLNEFRNYWNATPPIATPRDLAHLWTGKDLDGSTIGVAFVGVVCTSPTGSYGLSQKFPLNSSMTASTIVLTAHEIGHNFSARHTNQVTSEMPPDMNTPCDNSIMEASVGSGMNFCPMSRSQIIGHANGRATCLQLSGSGPPGFPSCVETPIDSTLSANGALASSDCRSPSRGVGFFADRYSFQGTAGQRLNITMNSTGGTFDPYLYLIGPSGFVISQDNNGNGGGNARISAAGTFTLPNSGKYIIEATSFSTGETGNYTVNVTLAGCTLSATPTSQHFPAGGGNGTINVTATGGGCSVSYAFLNSPSTATWLVPQTTNGTGSQALNFTVQPNTDNAGRRAFIVVGSAINDATGGLLIPITQSGTAPDCTLTPITLGQSVGGTLTTGSCQSPIRGNFFYADRYAFTVGAGQQVVITMTSTSADPFLSLVGPDGIVLLTDDDSGGGQNARIPGGQGFLTLGLPGTYIIETSMFSSAQTGSYTLTLTGGAVTAPTIFVREGTVNVAAAVDSVTNVAGPFRVLTPHNFSADGRRRLIFFTTDLGLAAGNTTGLSVQANGISLPVESAGPFAAISGSYIVVRLPDLAPNTYALTVTFNGVNSTNAPTFEIVP